MMISIVIPLYNKEKFIAETIDSVVKQTFIEFELIIVNDGSTDASEGVVKEISDPRIKLISIVNSGVSIARNKGIEQAQFDWVAFLDADDWWAPTFLEEVARAIATFPNESIFASGRNRVFNNIIDRYEHEYLPKEGTTRLVNYYKTITKYLPLINSSNVVIKKALFKNRGYFKPGQKQHEDHDLWLRLCVNNPVVVINNPLSFYRKTETNSGSSGSYDAKDFLMYLTSISEVYDELSEENKKYLRSYADRFIALAYLKNYRSYSRAERMTIAPFINRFCKGRYKAAYKVSQIAPFSIYPFLKLLQR